MSRNKIHGRCHICGKHRELTFEHIPPESAFNDRKVVYADVMTMLEKGVHPLRNFKGKQRQRGMGDYTLCSECNSFTGVQYGNCYACWTEQGMSVIGRTRFLSLLQLPFYIYPLQILKQVASMFLSLKTVAWRDANPDLVEFVLWRDRKYLDPKYRFYAFYSASPFQRLAGTVGNMLFNESFTKSKINVYGELTFPPFGYVLTVNRDPPDKRLVDISYFANYGYNEFRQVFLKLPVLPVYTHFPGDYRSREEVEAQLRENEQKQRSPTTA